MSDKADTRTSRKKSKVYWLHIDIWTGVQYKVSEADTHGEGWILAKGYTFTVESRMTDAIQDFKRKMYNG